MCTFLKYQETQSKTIYMICADKIADEMSKDEKLKVKILAQGTREEMKKKMNSLVYQPKFG